MRGLSRGQTTTGCSSETSKHLSSMLPLKSIKVPCPGDMEDPVADGRRRHIDATFFPFHNDGKWG